MSLGKSTHHFIPSRPLRMISLLAQSYLNWNALSPRRMLVNSGKSNHHSLSGGLTLKHNKKAVIECPHTEEEGLQLGKVYSLHHSLRTTLQFQRSVVEIVTHSIQVTNINHFQGKKIVNLTHGIITEGKTANLQFCQSLTVSQMEVTIWILREVLILLPLREAVFPNYDSPQLC